MKKKEVEGSVTVKRSLWQRLKSEKLLYHLQMLAYFKHAPCLLPV